jgi:ATP-dependent Clp protease ATP-binding subunit ClpB
MTSNLGSSLIKELSQDFERMEREVKAILEEHFRPEFLNRVDEVVIFRALPKDVIFQILDIQIDELRERLEMRGIGIEVEKGAKSELVERGYDPVYGARPLKRVLQRDVENPLALSILEGEYAEGDTVVVDLSEKKELVFRIK